MKKLILTFMLTLGFFRDGQAYIAQDHPFYSSYEKIKFCFLNVRNSRSCYVKGRCNENIESFYGKCIKPHESEIRAHTLRVQVLYLRPPGERGVLWPLNAKSSAPRGWGFHVVLDFEGEIFDLDWEPLWGYKRRYKIYHPSTYSYFSQMFGEVEERMVIHVTLARRYYREHRTRCQYRDYAFGRSQCVDHPHLSYEEYMERFGPYSD